MTRATFTKLTTAALGGILIAAIALAAAPGRSEAVFPGLNGNLLFARYDGGDTATCGLYTLNPGTLVETRVYSGCNTRSATFSPDGGKIAFAEVADIYSRSGDIYTIKSDGTAKTLVVSNGLDPSWSPDGTHIAFFRYEDRHDETEDCFLGWLVPFACFDKHGLASPVYILDITRSDARPVEVIPYGGRGGLEISPDGRRLLFTDYSTKGSHVAIVDIARTNGNIIGGHLTPPHEYISGFDWSADGSTITYAADGWIWTMGPNGENRRAIAGNVWEPYLNPTFSPDGRSIAFVQVAIGNNFGKPVHIYRMNRDGSNIRWIASGSLLDWQPFHSRFLPGGDGGTNELSRGPSPFCKVKSVDEGDTITCDDDRIVSMLQMDTPELDECGGGWARSALLNLFLPGQPQTVLLFDKTTTDAVGHTLAAPTVKDADGNEVNVSILMVYVGLARASIVGAGNTRFYDWALAAEAYARSQQFNMWQPDGPFSNNPINCG